MVHLNIILKGNMRWQSGIQGNRTSRTKRKVCGGYKKEAVAFCNTAGGIIYIGVADNGNVVGVADVDEGSKKPYYLYEKGLKPSGVYVGQGTSFV